MKDTQIKKLIDAEKKRQKKVINLIASENYVSKDVLEALGSELTNKYAEGYPGKRYYGGNEIIDTIERLCIERALKAFNLSPQEWHVNVQALSGSPANLAVYTALIPQGGKIMGMSLDQGGHLTHGHKVSATGKFWQQVPYADIVTTTTHKTLRGPRSALIFARIDTPGKMADRELGKKIDRAVFPGLQGGPHENQIAGIAVALKEATSPAFKKYAKQVVKNAAVLASELKGYGWNIISGGTDSHLVLVDTWMGGVKNDKGAGAVTGKDASDRLEKAGIIVNKNAIPFDTRPPADPSGIRLGSAAETTRGAREKDFKAIAKKIDQILRK